MPQPLPDKVFGNDGQLHGGILFTDVMPTGEFVDVARKALGTHLVIDPMIAPFQQDLKTFNHFRMGHISHIFPVKERTNGLRQRHHSHV